MVKQGRNFKGNARICFSLSAKCSHSTQAISTKYQSNQLNKKSYFNCWLSCSPYERLLNSYCYQFIQRATDYKHHHIVLRVPSDEMVIERMPFIGNQLQKGKLQEGWESCTAQERLVLLEQRPCLHPMINLKQSQTEIGGQYPEIPAHCVIYH